MTLNLDGLDPNPTYCSYSIVQIERRTVNSVNRSMKKLETPEHYYLYLFKFKRCRYSLSVFSSPNI